MAVIGGADNSLANWSKWRDPWLQGIGIFDLTDMEWKDHYDPSAASYTTPQAMKGWYEQNGRYPSAWDDPVVQGWFTGTGDSSSWLFSTIFDELTDIRTLQAPPNLHLLQQTRTKTDPMAAR